MPLATIVSFTHAVHQRGLAELQSQEQLEDSDEASSLLSPSRKYDLDLARARIDERNELFDHDVTEAAQLRRQFFRFGRKRMNLNVRRHDAVDRDRERRG